MHIFALAALGGGLSGGDRIFIELARNWNKKIPVNIYVWEEGLLMCKREHLKGINLKIKLIRVGYFSKLGFLFTYIYRIFLGIKLGLTLQIQECDYVYSASEFWMDSLPAVILKLRNPKIKWVAGWFQTAPNPLRGFTEGKREKIYRLNAFLYWFIQQPIKPLISKFADFILVNNKRESERFTALARCSKVIVVKGGVNIEVILKYLQAHKPPSNKRYLAVFQGRFHPQKGVVELIDIWKKVTDKIPDAKLAMIGKGPLMGDVKKRIERLSLQKNVKLFGYLHDGNKKYSIFTNSCLVVHPSFYDSGGMAAAEAMALGLPCIGFDLQAYSFYYPQGMIKVPVGNLEGFAGKVIQLNNDKYLYSNMSRDAKKMITKESSWTTRAAEVFNLIGLS